MSIVVPGQVWVLAALQRCQQRPLLCFQEFYILGLKFFLMLISLMYMEKTITLLSLAFPSWFLLMAVPSCLLPSRAQKPRSPFGSESRLPPVQNVFCFQKGIPSTEWYPPVSCVHLLFAGLWCSWPSLWASSPQKSYCSETTTHLIILCSLGSLLFPWNSHCFGEAQNMFILVKEFILTINCSLCTRLYDTVTFIRVDFCYINHNYLHAPPNMLKPY